METMTNSQPTPLSKTQRFSSLSPFLPNLNSQVPVPDLAQTVNREFS